MATSIEERCADTRVGLRVSARRHEQPGSTPSAGHRFSVVVAGGGPAAVEASLAIQRIAGGRVTITVVAPERFVHLPPPVLSPFAVGDRVAAFAGRAAWCEPS